MNFETQLALGVGVLLVVVLALAVRMSTIRKAKRFVSDRSPITDREFAAMFNNATEAAIAPAIRRLLKRYLSVDPALVRPDDRLCEDLQLAALDGLDANEFVGEVEKLASTSIPADAGAAMRTLRDIVSFVAAKRGQ